MGVWQSRQSFLYGPFCCIYGLGAVVITIFSKHFNKNNFTLFLGGCFLGSIIEYSISFFIELILDIQWWDYSNNIFNIHGRTCLIYSIFWGILTILLIKYINPFLDKFMNKVFRKKYIKKLILVTIIFLVIDCIITCYAQNVFITQIIIENDIETKDIETRKLAYEKIRENKLKNKIIEIYFSKEKMLKTFPNIKIKDKNNNIIYIDKILSDIKPYYIKIFNKKIV